MPKGLVLYLPLLVMTWGAGSNFIQVNFPPKLVCSSNFNLIKCLQLHVFQILNDFNYIHNQIGNEFNYTSDVTGSEALHKNVPSECRLLDGFNCTSPFKILLKVDSLMRDIAAPVSCSISML